MIHFDNVTFSYNKKSETSFAVKEVSFSCQKALINGFVGRNGCGKSTIARLIAGLLLPDEGVVTVADQNTSDDDALIHGLVGLIFQNPDNQIVGTTVEEDLAFGLENLAMNPDQMHEKVALIAEEIGISHLLDMPVHHLSGGQKQLLCIASVLVMEPKWLIFDEPTSHLDPWSRIEFWQTLRKLIKDRGIGAVVITQLPDEILNFDRIYAFEEGRIIFDGTRVELENNKSIHHKVSIPESWKLKKMMRMQNAP